MAQTDAPFLASQLEFYKSHSAKLMELQAAHGSAVDPSAFMPSSDMYDELIGAFRQPSVTAHSTRGASAPSSSQAQSQDPNAYTGSSSSSSSTNSSNSSSLNDDFSTALGSSLTNSVGPVLGGIYSAITGNIPGVVKAAITVGSNAVTSYNAIKALYTPTVGESPGQTPTADLAAHAALGDTSAEVASNYDNRMQQPTFTPVYGEKTYGSGQSPTGYNANPVTLQGQLLGYKNSVTGEVSQSRTSSSSGSNPYDDYFSNTSNPYSGYQTYGTSEGE